MVDMQQGRLTGYCPHLAETGSQHLRRILMLGTQSTRPPAPLLTMRAHVELLARDHSPACDASTHHQDSVSVCGWGAADGRKLCLGHRGHMPRSCAPPIALASMTPKVRCPL